MEGRQWQSAMPKRTNRGEGRPRRQKSPGNRTQPLPGQDYTLRQTSGRIGETPCPGAKLDMEQHIRKKTMDKNKTTYMDFFVIFSTFEQQQLKLYDGNLAANTLGSKRVTEDEGGQPGRKTDLTGKGPRLSL